MNAQFHKVELAAVMVDMMAQCATEDTIAKALEAMFDDHEPEGRFQPSHFKGPLFRAVRALAKYHNVTEDVMRDRLAERWRVAQRAREDEVRKEQRGTGDIFVWASSGLPDRRNN